jgi:hemerythrin-like metal-binding protein
MGEITIMEPIQWKEEYEVGNYEIDAQHKMFIDLIEKIDREVREYPDKDYLNNLLCELKMYTEFHFISEENIMFRVGYPELLDHKKQHQALVEELGNRVYILNQKFVDFEELLDFLCTWFLEHTATEDTKLASFLKK